MGDEKEWGFGREMEGVFHIIFSCINIIIIRLISNSIVQFMSHHNDEPEELCNG